MFGGINAAMKFADMADKLINDAGLRKKFDRDGKIGGRLQIEQSHYFQHLPHWHQEPDFQSDNPRG